MALNKTLLSNSIYQAFIRMNEMGKSNIGFSEGNTYAANQIASALDTYLKSAQISSSSDLGTYSGYTYTGSSTGTGININVTSLTTRLASHFMADDLNDNKIADYIANDINFAIENAIINVTSSGKYVIPGNPPQILPGTGNGSGSFTGIPSILSTDLKRMFATMLERAKNADENYNGNREFANCLADSIDRYIKQPGCLILNYTGPLLYCISNGAIV